MAFGEQFVGLLLGWTLSCLSPAQTPSADAPAAAQEPAAPATSEQAAPATPAPAVSAPQKPAKRTPVPPAARSGLRVPHSTRKRPSAPVSKHPSPYHGDTQNIKAREFYSAAWGIDRLRVSYTMSGNLIRFSFRVVQPKIAKALGDHEATPHLFAPRTNAMLQVPNMEMVGQLRQLHTEEVNKDYWMVFSNKGNLVHRGDRVNVIIGKFHADGLVVE
ncbi:MAG: hypothetical protein ABJC66_00990 [Gammaproteobacteria bacterium]